LFTDKKGSNHHWTDGNWTDLAGTSLSWMLLDLSFYFLGIYNKSVISILWHPTKSTNIYSMWIRDGWQALISNSIGALLGGAIFIILSRYRYNLQLYGFLILAMLFVVTGVTLLTVSNGRYFAVIIVLYGWCRLFFNLGPNASVFIIPAEVFPTQYRCTCLGISAAAGKVGSIIGQLVTARWNDSTAAWLGKVVLGLTACNILGAVLTKFWVPNPCNIDGESRTLEDLSRGKKKAQRNGNRRVGKEIASRGRGPFHRLKTQEKSVRLRY